MNEKTITLSLEKARELYKNGGTDMKVLILENFTKEERKALNL